jgi:hypothetical protein
MAGTPRLRVKKYFGSSNVQELDITLEEAKEQLSYFWTKDGSTNIKVAIDGQAINSYDELVKTVNLDRYTGKAFIDVGLFLSNAGFDSIWPKRPAV